MKRPEAEPEAQQDKPGGGAGGTQLGGRRRDEEPRAAPAAPPGRPSDKAGRESDHRPSGRARAAGVGPASAAFRGLAPSSLSCSCWDDRDKGGRHGFGEHPPVLQHCSAVGTPTHARRGSRQGRSDERTGVPRAPGTTSPRSPLQPHSPRQSPGRPPAAGAASGPCPAPSRRSCGELPLSWAGAAFSKSRFQ